MGFLDRFGSGGGKSERPKMVEKFLQQIKGARTENASVEETPVDDTKEVNEVNIPVRHADISRGNGPPLTRDQIAALAQERIALEESIGQFKRGQEVFGYKGSTPGGHMADRNLLEQKERRLEEINEQLRRGAA